MKDIVFEEMPTSEISIKRRGLVCGVGINDAKYLVMPRINGKQVTCQIYQKWVSMLKRCYSHKLQKRQPSYVGCTVCKEWIHFSSFKSWIEKQDWKGKHLDKDILKEGNKIYAPEYCLFVTKEVNNFFLERGASRGELPIGVSIRNDNKKKYQASCRNPLNKKSGHIGFFETKELAHSAYKKRKAEYADLLANSKYVDNDAVKSAILRRFNGGV
jgi:hypothetical protein